MRVYKSYLCNKLRHRSASETRHESRFGQRIKCLKHVIQNEFHTWFFSAIAKIFYNGNIQKFIDLVKLTNNFWFPKHYEHKFIKYIIITSKLYFFLVCNSFDLFSIRIFITDSAAFSISEMTVNVNIISRFWLCHNFH